MENVISVSVPGEQKYAVVIHMFLSGIAATMDMDVDTMDDLHLAGDETLSFLLNDACCPQVQVQVEEMPREVAVTYTGKSTLDVPEENTVLMKEILETLTVSAQVTSSRESVQIRLVVPKAV